MSKSVVETIGTVAFVDQLAEKQDISKAKAGEQLRAVLDLIESNLAKGNTVTFTGFGTFSIRARSARTGRNPRSGEEIKIPASNVPGFKPGAVLKKAVNAKKK